MQPTTGRTTMRAGARLMLAATAAAGCGGDTGPNGDGAVRLESGHAVSARIGSAGGTLQTVDRAGRKYLLEIPALALRDSQDVTLTPVAEMDLPDGTSLVAAAHFEPEGLLLAVPARLRIVGPGGTPGIAAFGYSGDAEALHLEFMGRRGDTLFIPVRHFSGAGAATTPDIALLTEAGPGAAAVQAFIAVEQLSYQGADAGAYDVPALAAAMKSWADAVVVPGLQAANSEQSLLDAVAGFSAWVSILECGADNAPPCTGGALHLWPETVRRDVNAALFATFAQLQTELAKALKAGIDRLKATCIASHDLQAASNSIFWDGIALAYGVETLAPGLDATFFDTFCVALVIESVTLPATLAAGTPAQLRVTAGLSFGGGAPDHAQPLLVTVSAGNSGNATPASASGSTANGVYTATFTPGGTSPIFFGINAALKTLQLDLRAFIAADTTFEQAYGGVTVAPSAAILNPGATAQFTATVTGLGNTAVTWSATGGTISGTGLYTAGSTAGTYAVTATSVADPLQKATARIDIVAASGVTVALSPTSASVAPGATKQFTATVNGSANQAVTWAATGGTLVVAGNTATYTAGATPGTYTVTATSVASPSASGTAAVAVGFGAGDIYVGTLQMATGWTSSRCRNGATTCPVAIIFSAAQNQLVLCHVTSNAVAPSIYSAACETLGSPFSDRVGGQPNLAALHSAAVTAGGGVSTTPGGGCYLQGSLANAVIVGGVVRGTSITGTYHCPAPAGGSYLPYFTFTAAIR